MTRRLSRLADTSPESIALALTRARLALRAHATVYAVVNAGLILVWLLTPATRFWPGFVIAGWGVGLALQALRTASSAPGTPAWRRIHAQELARARREAAGT